MTSASIVEYELCKLRIDNIYETAIAASKLETSTVTICNTFKAKFKDLGNIKEQFLQCHVVIEARPPKEFDLVKHRETFNIYMDKYYSICVIYDNCFGSSSKEGIVKQESNSQQVAHHIELPKIKLPTFDGTWLKWSNFKSMYTSLIHENESLLPVQKFHYLLSSLSGDALSIISHLTISSDNYDIAYDLLVKRFDNKRLIADAHIEMLLNLPNVQIRGSLRKFLDTINENVLALKALGFPTDQWSYLLIHILTKKMDLSLRNQFELQLNNAHVDTPTLKDLTDFLESRCLAYESSSSQQPTQTQRTSTSKPKVMFSNAAHINTCKCCKTESHELFTCKKFLSMLPINRLEFIKSINHCFNCLRGHYSSKCISKNVCKECGRSHHTLLHITKETNTNDQQVSSGVSAIGELCATGSYQGNSTVLLATAIINIQNSKGNWVEVRSLIDSGSQCSFITTSCAKKLNLEVSLSSSSISALGGQIQPTSGWVSCKFKSRFESAQSVFKTSACVLQQITRDLPSANIPNNILHHFEGFQLADPTFYKPGKIDFLIGADLYDSILMNSMPIRMLPELPAALQTKLGFILMGKTSFGSDDSASCCISAFHGCLETSIEKFWEIEDYPHKLNSLRKEEEFCETYFKETYSRESDGRFCVTIPFKENPSILGNSKELSTKRFYSLEKRLNKNQSVKEDYSKFLVEYEQLGHMKEVTSGGQYYIPHHEVISQSSTTTKLRVVFDGSMRTSNGLSLNQIMYPGPKLQQNIVDILIRFRIHAVVFTCDIKQMYRQILIHPDHCPVQHILWRSDSQQPLKEYALQTVTYGLASSPFLAQRCIQELGEIGKSSHPLASKAILKIMFVDDFVSGTDSLQTAIELRDQLIDLLKSGGFNLHKWSSNSKDFLTTLSSEMCEQTQNYNIEDNSIMKILGLKWNSSSDNFIYTSQMESNNFTKRAILSSIAKIYDPCGWLTPVIFKAKCFMQTLWMLHIGWDDIPSEEFISQWISFAKTFISLNNVAIPRNLGIKLGSDIQLHGFSDASEKGYGSVVYLRVSNGDITNVYLLLAKSKVAPLKQRLTIPKLELSGALLAAKLVSYTKNILSHIQFSLVHIWCDSSIVLSWLQKSPHTLRVFEGNRVSEIHRLVEPSVWRHIPSDMNPADAASRGLNPDELVKHHLWWNVPWLSLSMDSWPSRIFEVTKDRPTNQDDIDCLVTQDISQEPLEENHPVIHRYSNSTRLVRVTALIMRFIQNCRSKEKTVGYLTSKELDEALMVLIREVQYNQFSKEINELKKSSMTKSNLDKLSPFIDTNGLLRVGGRLTHSNLAYNSKHPILLPRNHHLTNLIIDDYHVRYLHAGPTFVLSVIRQKFWIISGRQVVRHRIFKCVKCFKVKPRFDEPKMGDLPKDRVQPSKPFTYVAADFAGPFFIKTSTLRNAKIIKVYMCVFVCFSTKACHLELVTDLTSEAFLATFYRFISRRGLCREIYTDNGTNFKGVANHLKELYNSLEANIDTINSKLVDQKVVWRFCPASAPHFNGLVESAVKSTKFHLLRVIGDQRLTYEELSTLLCRIEAILNSRPLHHLPSTPDESPQVLTPGHFLIGCPLTSIPEPSFDNTPKYRLSRWQLLQQMTQGFWKHWSKEYLQSLQQRSKWLKSKTNLQIDDVVLIKDDNLPPLQWKLGKVTALHPGKDLVVRAVSIKTQNGTLVRPVVKLCKLPLED